MFKKLFFQVETRPIQYCKLEVVGHSSGTKLQLSNLVLVNNNAKEKSHKLTFVKVEHPRCRSEVKVEPPL